VGVLLKHHPTCATCSEHARHDSQTTTRPSIIRSSIHSFLRPLVRSFIRPLVRRFVHSSIRYWFFCRPFVRLSVYSTLFPGAGHLSVPACSFPSRHLLCCGGRSSCAIWKSASGGEGYKRRGSYNPSGVFISVFFIG